MIHEILHVGPLQCACSVIGDETTRKAIVVDPGDDIEQVLALIQKHKLTVEQIVITHAHIDHVGGAMKLRAATGAPILMNQDDYALLQTLEAQAAWLGMKSPGAVAIDQSIGSSDSLTIGTIVADVFHTPGHTEGSICLYFPPEKKLLAGDTLFSGSVGRTDLPGGSFDKIIRSIRDQLLPLPDDTIVIPGHGPATTIGRERRSNPFLASSSR
jgi:glyoxylase-like metal-dependent hydrolase (beta-lactamase superfamily II)